MNKPDVIKYLQEWRDLCSYEHAAMSEAQFSTFLKGLIEIMKEEA